MILIYIFYYFIIGLVIAIINWGYIVSDEVKKYTSVHLVLPMSVILWPIIFVNFIANTIKFIEKEY